MDIQRMKELIVQRERIDEELTAIVTDNVAPKERKAIRCSVCSQEGHTARTCKKGDSDETQAKT